MQTSENGVHLQKIITERDGTSRFVDEIIPYVDNGEPLRSTAPIPASSLSFRYTPGSFDLAPHIAPQRGLLMVTDGVVEISVSTGESRIFRPGGILSLGDTWGQGHRSRAVDGKSFRSTYIGLESEMALAPRSPLPNQKSEGVDYLHNQGWPDGTSYFEKKHMPIIHGGLEGEETDELPLRAYQFVMAPADLDYDWHPAPQRQVVLVLTGGLAMEYGDGSHAEVPQGGFLIGDDTNGKGHITRALNGKPRFSVFAHLA